jgi:cobalt-zinc-cadmium efflux system protein
MSTSESALTAHLVIPDGTSDDTLLARIERELHDTFGIEHATIQIERDGACDRCRLHLA